MAVDWSQFKPLEPAVDWSQFKPLADFSNVESGAESRPSFANVKGGALMSAAEDDRRRTEAGIRSGEIPLPNDGVPVAEKRLSLADMTKGGWGASLDELADSPVAKAVSDNPLLKGFAGRANEAAAAANLMTAIPVAVGIDALRGDDAATNYAGKMVQSRRDAAAELAPAQDADLVNKSASALGSLAFDLPIAAISKPAEAIGALPKFLAATDLASAKQFLSEAFKEAAMSARIPATTAGITTALSVIENGGTPDQAINAGLSESAGTWFNFVLPMNLPGGAISRGAQGAGINVAGDAAQNALVNQFLPADMQRDIYDPEQAVISAVIGAPMGVVLGERGGSHTAGQRHATDLTNELASQAPKTPEEHAVQTGSDIVNKIFAETGATQAPEGVPEMIRPGAPPRSFVPDQTPLTPEFDPQSLLKDLDNEPGPSSAETVQGSAKPAENHVLTGEPELINNGKRVFYPGDTAAMRAKLEAAGLNPGMRKVGENGEDLGLYFPAKMQADVDAVLRASKPSADTVAQAEPVVKPDATVDAPVVEESTPAPTPYEGAKLPPERKPRNQVRNAGDFDPNYHDIRDFIALNGGLDFGAFKSEFNSEIPGDNMRFFGKPLFRKKGGMKPDQLRELMQESGFLNQDSPDAPPQYTPQDAYDLVDRALDGQPVYHPQGVDTQNQILADNEYYAEQSRRQEYIDEHGVTPELDEEFAQRASALDRGDLERDVERIDLDSVREDTTTYGNTRQIPSEQENGSSVAEPGAADRKGRGTVSGSLDLFTRTRGQADEVQSSAPRLFQSAKVVSVGQFSSGVEKIRDWKDAAHVLAPLRKSPQEQMMAVVADADGKPIAILRHTMGLVDQSAVSPYTVFGAIAQIPGAKQVWFGHNHPSGSPKQSAADKAITLKLGSLMRGSGIQTNGMIVVSPGNTEATYFNSDTGNNGESPERITAAARKGSVPVVERVLRKIPAGDRLEVTSPQLAEDAVKQFGKESGVILLDNKNAVVGFLPMTEGEMAKVRTGDAKTGSARVMRAATEANAAAAITVSKDILAGQNVGGLLDEAGLRALDLMHVGSDGSINSMARVGRAIAAPVFYSKSARPEIKRSQRPDSKGIEVDEATDLTPEEMAAFNRQVDTGNRSRKDSANDGTRLPADSRQLRGSPDAGTTAGRAGMVRPRGGLYSEVPVRSVSTTADTPADVSGKAPKFGQWFRKSKMKGAAGKPMDFHHATNADFTEFDPKFRGKSTNFAPAGLGNWFSQDADKIGSYGGKMLSGNLRLENPLVINSYELADFDSQAEYEQHAKELMAEGYDGIYFPDSKQAVAFDSVQFKENNNTEYSESPNIYRSQRNDDAKIFDDSGDYSSTEDMVEGVRNGDLLVHFRVKDGTDFQYGIDPSAGEFLRSTEAWQESESEHGEGPELTFFSENFDWGNDDFLSKIRKSDSKLEAVFVRKNDTLQKSLGNGRVLGGDGKESSYEMSRMADYENPLFKSEPAGVEKGDWYTEKSQDVVGVASAESVKAAIDATNPSILKSEGKKSAPKRLTDDQVKQAKADAESPEQAAAKNAAAEKTVAKTLGRSEIKRLKDKGNLKFLTTAQVMELGINGAKSQSDLRGVDGFYDAKSGNVYIISDSGANPDSLAGVVVHEIVHSNMEAFLGTDGFQKLIKAFVRESATDAEAKAAMTHARTVDGDKSEAVQQEEGLAYFAQQNPDHPLTKRLVDEGKLFLNRLGVPLTWLNANNAALRKIISLNLKDAQYRDRSHSIGKGGVKYQRVFHGTPHRDIEKEGFKLNKIGTGEGAQAYGYGMYFAGNKDIAEHYRNTLSSTMADQVRRFALDEVEAAGGDIAAAIDRFKRVAENAHKIGSENAAIYDRGVAWIEAGMPESLGQLYHAEIPEDSDLLDYDKPLSEQPDKVRDAVNRIIDTVPYPLSESPRMAAEWREKMPKSVENNRSMARFYRDLTDQLGAPALASQALNDAGIPGLRYLDGTSRSKGEGSANYVIWDENLLTPEKAQITPYYSKRDKPKPKVTGARPEELIEVRKQISSFRTLIKCLGG